MTLALQQTEIYEQLNRPDSLAFPHISDVRLQKDVWNIEQDIPLLMKYTHNGSRTHISFEGISLLWLKDLTKIAVLSKVANQRWGLSVIYGTIVVVKKFNNWLVEQGYVTFSALTTQAVQQWEQNAKVGDKNALQGFLGALRRLGCISISIKRSEITKPSSVRTVPERVKYQLDLALIQLDKPIYLAFKLLEAAAARSIEIAKIPLDCLKVGNGVHQVILSTAKQRGSKQRQDLPAELVPLVQAQQAFVRQTFGEDFPWLFPNWTIVPQGFQRKGYPPKFQYHHKQLKKGGTKLNNILKIVIRENNIRDDEGNLAYVTTHMYRRTYATVAQHMGKRPDQIQHGLRHLNPDMQDHYINISPQEQEKQLVRILVDKQGQTTTYHTDRDREFLRRQWKAREVELGVCTRPNIMKDCEFEHICLSCEYSRYGQEHLPKILEAHKRYEVFLKQCVESGQSDSRRANSARQFISALNHIIVGLQNSMALEVGE